MSAQWPGQPSLNGRRPVNKARPATSAGRRSSARGSAKARRYIEGTEDDITRELDAPFEPKTVRQHFGPGVKSCHVA